MKRIITQFAQPLLAPLVAGFMCCWANTVGAASIGTPAYSSLPDSTPPTNNLTAVGTLDWKVYGKQGGPTQTPSESKNGGSSITMLAPVITSPCAADNSAIGRANLAFSWSDGTPDATGTAVNPLDNGLAFGNAATAGYYASYETVTFVPGDTHQHTVHLYGYFQNNNQGMSLQFSNNLAGASPVLYTSSAPALGDFDYSVSFQADNPTNALTVVFTFQKTGTTGSAKRMGINAATIDAYVPPSLNWQGNVNSSWDIATTANWTNSSGAAVNYTETSGVGDSSVTFDDTAVNYLVNVATAVHPLTILVNNSANNYVLSNSPSASLGGSGGLTKQGTGVLTLYGAGNSFSNGVVVSGGTLQLGADQSIPDGAGFGIVQMSGSSTLDLNGHSETINGLSNPLGGGTVDNVAGGGTSTLTVGNNNASSAFSGTIQNSSGIVALSKTGTGSLTLSGTNTFVGGVTLNGGQLNLNSPGALGNGPLTIAASGVLLNNSSSAVLTLTTTNAQSWNGDFTFVGTRNLNFGPGTVSMNASRTVTVTANSLAVGGPVTGAGFGLTKNGAGTLQINYSNTFNGPIQINAGLVQLSTAHQGGGAVTLATNASLQVNSGLPGTTLNTSALAFGTTSGNTNVLTLNFGTNANPTKALITAGSLTAPNSVKVNISGSDLSVGQFPLISYGGNIGGAGFSAFQLGTLPYPSFVATLVDNSTNHSVDLNISAAGGPPKIWVGGVNNSWDVSTTTNWLDSILSVAAVYTETVLVGDVALFDDTASNATVNIVAPVKPYSVTVNNSNLNYTISGAAITGPCTFTKQGKGSLTLTGNNTFTNNFNLQGGTVYLGANGAMGAGGVNLSGQTTLSSDSASPRTVTNAVSIGTTASANVNLGDPTNNGVLTLSGRANLSNNPQISLLSDAIISGGSTNGSIILVSINTNTPTGAGTNTLTLRGVYNGYYGDDINSGNLILDGAFVTNTAGHASYAMLVGCNQTNGTARLVITNGGALVLSTSNANFRVGFSAFGNTTAGGTSAGATNEVDVAGVFALPNGNGQVIMGRSATLSVINLLTNGIMQVGQVGNSDISANKCTAVFNFNGGTLQPTIDSTTFLQGLNNAYVQAGGAIFDTGGHNITVNQPLLVPADASPSGGLTKNGAGILTLGGVNTYTGITTVNQGELFITTAVTGGGAITVAGSGSLGIRVATQGAYLNASAATLGTSASHSGSLDLNYVATFVDVNNAPFVVGTLAANGTNTININVTNTLSAGQYPLIKYSGSLASGVFSTFRLGTLPPGKRGVLVNNTSNQSIDINVTDNTNPATIASVTITNGNAVLSGTNGVPNGTYLVLTSTNLSLPLASWLPVATNTFDSSGGFTALIPFTNTVPSQFFLLQQ